MQSPCTGFQTGVEDKIAVRGFNQVYASPITERGEGRQDPTTLQSPTVPQSALAARLKDPISPATELKDPRGNGSTDRAEPSATDDKNKVVANHSAEFLDCRAHSKFIPNIRTCFSAPDIPRALDIFLLSHQYSVAVPSIHHKFKDGLGRYLLGQESSTRPSETSD